MDEKAKLMRCIIERILDEYNKGKTLDKKRIEQIKAECLRIHRIGIGHPSNSEILQYATEEEKKILIPILRKKPVRTISGVAVVAVMTSPEKMPSWKMYLLPRRSWKCIWRCATKLHWKRASHYERFDVQLRPIFTNKGKD